MPLAVADALQALRYTWVVHMECNGSSRGHCVQTVDMMSEHAVHANLCLTKLFKLLQKHETYILYCMCIYVYMKDAGSKEESKGSYHLLSLRQRVHLNM